MRAIVVEALGDPAGFYRRFGFEPVEADDRTLMVTVARLRRVLME